MQHHIGTFYDQLKCILTDKYENNDVVNITRIKHFLLADDNMAWTGQKAKWTSFRERTWEKKKNFLENIPTILTWNTFICDISHLTRVGHYLNSKFVHDKYLQERVSRTDNGQMNHYKMKYKLKEWANKSSPDIYKREINKNIKQGEKK